MPADASCRFVPGVAEGGASCVRGRCQVTACTDGWSVREREDGDTACIYHVYGGIFRGGPSDEAWVASHIAQWALPSTATHDGIGAAEVPWTEEPEPEYMDESEVRALIAQVQRARKENGERPLPVQAKAEAQAHAAEPPRVPAAVDTADEDTPRVRDAAPVEATHMADEESPRARMRLRP